MQGIRDLFEEKGKNPEEILERIEAGPNPAWKEALQATRRIFDPEQEARKLSKQDENESIEQPFFYLC